MARAFAFGKTETDDCLCPAATAGFDPGDDNSTDAAEWYDDLLRGRTGDALGTVGEETARDVWLEVVEILDGYRDKDPFYEPDYLAAREVAIELGWI